MFFFITNNAVGQYYPNLLLQFLIASVLYIISFLVIKDMSDEIDRYKYYILLIIILDVFLVYLIIRNKKYQKDKLKEQETEPNIIESFPSIEPSTGNLYSISLTSEMNDFRISHQLTLDSDNTIFSSSEQPKDKESSSEKI